MPQGDMSNNKLFGWLSVETTITLLIVGAGVVGSWSTIRQGLEEQSKTIEAHTIAIAALTAETHGIKVQQAKTSTILESQSKDIDELKEGNKDILRALLPSVANYEEQNPSNSRPRL